MKLSSKPKEPLVAGAGALASTANSDPNKDLTVKIPPKIKKNRSKSNSSSSSLPIKDSQDPNDSSTLTTLDSPSHSSTNVLDSARSHDSNYQQQSGSSLALKKAKKKKPKTKRVGVRFVEQKHMYFYEDDDIPIENRKVSVGFTSFNGLDDEIHDSLLRDMIRIAIQPITTISPPFSSQQLFTYIKSAFGVDNEKWDRIFNEEQKKWDIYALYNFISESSSTNLDKHEFYSAEAFNQASDHEYWQETERNRLEQLLQYIRDSYPGFDIQKLDHSKVGTSRRGRSKPNTSDSTSTSKVQVRSHDSRQPVSRSASDSYASTDRNERSRVTRKGSGLVPEPESAREKHPVHTPATLGLALETSTDSREADHIRSSNSSTLQTSTHYQGSSSKSGTVNNIPNGSTPPIVAQSSEASSDLRDDDDSLSSSLSEAHWKGRTPRVAIRPLAFVNDDQSDDSEPQEYTPTGSARKSDIEQGSETPRDQYGSGSDPASPRSEGSENANLRGRSGSSEFVATKFSGTDWNQESEAFVSDQIEISDDIKRPLLRGPCRLETLFRNFINFELTNLRAQEKRITKLLPLLEKAHTAISNEFSLDRHVNMFDALTELNPDASISGFSGTCFFINKSTAPYTEETHFYDISSDLEKTLFGLPPIARWLLGEYSILMGYSPLMQNLIHLNYIVSTLEPNADKLLLLYVLMTRVLDLLQDEELLPIPSSLETLYFAQIMRELNRDAENNFYNMFGHFSYEDLAALKMLLNILSLIYECNEYLGEPPPQTYKAYLEQALEESIRNYYREVISDAEEVKEATGSEPIGTVVRRKQRFERLLSADQLLAACDAMNELLAHLGPYQKLFDGLSHSLFDICCKAYIRQLFSDTGLFAVKLARTQPVSRVLALANGIIEINKLCSKPDTRKRSYTNAVPNEPETEDEGLSPMIEPLPVERLFGSFLVDWLNQTEDSMKDWVTTTCKIERWLPVDQSRGKLWSPCSWDLFKLCTSHMNMVYNNELLFSLTIQAKMAEDGQDFPDSMSLGRSGNERGSKGSKGSKGLSGNAVGYRGETLIERKKSYFYQYCLVISRVLREFVENVYNHFVEEFPPDLHSDLHDLYIREYHNMTTGGSGLHLTYRKKKKTFFSWLSGIVGSKSSDNIETLGTRYSSMSSSESQPKLGKKKSSKDISSEDGDEDNDNPETTLTVNGKANNNAYSASSASSIAVNESDDPHRELIINVWSLITFDPKKVVKMRKLRKRIDLKKTMCTKINDLDSLRAFFDKLLVNEPQFNLACTPAFVLMHKVFKTFLHMVIYVINMHLDTELEHIYKKSTKKIPGSVFEAERNLLQNILDQLATMRTNLRPNIFKRLLLRVWKVLNEDIESLLAPEDDDGKPNLPPTGLQIAAIESILMLLKDAFCAYGMSTTHITSKIADLLDPVRSKIPEDELNSSRTAYSIEKDKWMKKEKKKPIPINPAPAPAGPTSTSSTPSVPRKHRSQSSTGSLMSDDISETKRTSSVRGLNGRKDPSEPNHPQRTRHRAESTSSTKSSEEVKRNNFSNIQQISVSSFAAELSMTEMSDDTDAYSILKSSPSKTSSSPNKEHDVLIEEVKEVPQTRIVPQVSVREKKPK